MTTVDILGVPINDTTYDAALARVQEFLREGGLHQIATVNPEFVVLAQTNAEFMRVLKQTCLNVPDGVGLLWAARRMGHPLRTRVTGQELVDLIAGLATKTGDGIFLLGARPGVAERAAESLKARHKGLHIAGCFAGSPLQTEDDQIVARVNQTGARILFVAYGPPQQELWLARNAARLQARVGMGVGGTFDTLAGIVPRAPGWMRQAGLEWLYRLVREPRRLKRQLAIPYFIWLVLTRARKDAQ